MKVIIDRFEGDYAIVEIEVGKCVNLPKVLVPNSKEGDVINIELANKETEDRKNKINNLMNNLFEE